MNPLSPKAKAKIKAERFAKVVYACDVLHLSESELDRVLENGFYEIAKAQNNPFFRDKPYQRIVNTLVSQGYLPRYWQRYVALGNVRAKVKDGKKTTTAYIDKYKLVHSSTDNLYHLNNKDGKLDPHKWLSDLAIIDPSAPINNDISIAVGNDIDDFLMLYYRPSTPPMRGTHSFDPADIVIEPPSPTLPKITGGIQKGVWLAPNHPNFVCKPSNYWESLEYLYYGTVSGVVDDSVNKANQSTEKTSFQNTPKNTPTKPVFKSFELVYTQKRQNTPYLNKTNNNHSLENVYNLSPHQYYKYKSVEYSKSLLPKKHRLHSCMKLFLESLKIYIDDKGDTKRMHTHGACRCELPTCVYCNVFDGQNENARAKLLQQTLLEQGYNLHKSTLTYPHHKPDITQDYPLLKLAKRKFYKEFQRQIAKHLPELDIEFNVSSLETPINIKNGVNAHYNYVWAIKQEMTSSQKRTFNRLQYQTWLRALVLVGLVAKGDNPDKISHVKFNDRNALAYITKYENSYHTPESLADIEERWLAGESISKFELLSLGQYGRVSQSLVRDQYRQLVTALGSKNLIKYSSDMTAFCLEHELIINDNAPQADSEPLPHDPDICTPHESIELIQHDRPIKEPVTVTQYDLFGEPVITTYKYRKSGGGRKGRTHKHTFDPLQQQTFAPELERVLQQAIKRANRPRHRWITDPCRDNWYLLADFTGIEWQTKYKGYEQLGMINRLKAMYLNGDYPRKPTGYIRENPLPS